MDASSKNIVGLCLLSLLMGMALISCDPPPPIEPPPPKPVECACPEKTHLNDKPYYNGETFVDEIERCECPANHYIDDNSEVDPDAEAEVVLCDCTVKIKTKLSNGETWVIKEVGVLEEEFNIFLALFNGICAEFTPSNEYAFINNVTEIRVQTGAGIEYTDIRGRSVNGIERHDKLLIFGCNAEWDEIERFLVNNRIISPLYFQ